MRICLWLNVAFVLHISLVSHPCWTSNGGCSHLCIGVLSNEEGFVASCRCPTGYVLQEDEKTCETSKEWTKDSLYLKFARA